MTNKRAPNTIFENIWAIADGFKLFTKSRQSTERSFEDDFEERSHSEWILCVQESEPYVEPIQSSAMIHNEQIPALLWNSSRILIQTMSKHTDFSAEKHF